jgi:hypothetical protein
MIDDVVFIYIHSSNGTIYREKINPYQIQRLQRQSEVEKSPLCGGVMMYQKK